MESEWKWLRIESNGGLWAWNLRVLITLSTIIIIIVCVQTCLQAKDVPLIQKRSYWWTRSSLLRRWKMLYHVPFGPRCLFLLVFYNWGIFCPLNVNCTPHTNRNSCLHAQARQMFMSFSSKPRSVNSCAVTCYSIASQQADSTGLRHAAPFLVPIQRPNFHQHN